MMHRFAPGDSFQGACVKAIFEQCTLEPICIFVYMIYDGIMQRKSVSEIRYNIKTQFFGLWMKNAMFWVPGNFSNYYWGTPELRVVFANMCSFWWNTYFSICMARFAKPVHPKDPLSPLPNNAALEYDYLDDTGDDSPVAANISTSTIALSRDARR